MKSGKGQQGREKIGCFAFYSIGKVLEIPHILLLLTVCLLFITGLLGLTKVIASSSFNLNLVKANYLLQTVGNILLPQNSINLQKAATKKNVRPDDHITVHILHSNEVPYVANSRTV